MDDKNFGKYSVYDEEAVHPFLIYTFAILSLSVCNSTGNLSSEWCSYFKRDNKKVCLIIAFGKETKSWRSGYDPHARLSCRLLVCL